MLGASYLTKKQLKASIGEKLRYIETSMFGEEYRSDGIVTVVGPDPYSARDWFAEVKMANDRIVKVT